MEISDFEYYGAVRLKAVISDAISDALFAIDAEKSDSIDTDDIRNYTFGATPVEGEFPALSIMSIREFPVRDEEEWKISHFTYDIEVINVGDDMQVLEKQCARYARALKDILWDAFKTLGTIQSIDYPPAMNRGNALFKGVGLLFRLTVVENRVD